MIFLFFFQITVENFLSGKLWKWPGQLPKRQPSRNRPKGCEMQKKVWAQLKQKTRTTRLWLTMSPGATLGTSSIHWMESKGTPFLSDHRYYCSETCQRNVKLNCARRMHEKGFMRMQAHPHFTTFTLWTLSSALPWPPLLATRRPEHQLFPRFYLDKVNAQTFLNIFLI